jgi:hypothetical protein
MADSLRAIDAPAVVCFKEFGGLTHGHREQMPEPSGSHLPGVDQRLFQRTEQAVEA